MRELASLTAGAPAAWRACEAAGRQYVAYRLRELGAIHGAVDSGVAALVGLEGQCLADAQYLRAEAARRYALGETPGALDLWRIANGLATTVSRLQATYLRALTVASRQQAPSPEWSSLLADGTGVEADPPGGTPSVAGRPDSAAAFGLEGEGVVEKLGPQPLDNDPQPKPQDFSENGQITASAKSFLHDFEQDAGFPDPATDDESEDS